MKIADHIQNKWNAYIQQIKEERGSHYYEVSEKYRYIYDEVKIFYVYSFHAAYSEQMLIEYDGIKTWMFVDHDMGLTYYLDDKEGKLNDTPLGEHEYDDFFEFEKRPIGEIFNLNLSNEEWDNFGLVFGAFDLYELYREIVEMDYKSKYKKFVENFDYSGIKIKRKNGWIYFDLGNGDEIRYKHLSDI